MAEDSQRRATLTATVRKIANQYGLDVRLLDAIVTVESSYNTWAARYEERFAYSVIPTPFAKANGISNITELNHQKTSWGLCQIMGATARHFGYKDALTMLVIPEVNLPLGCKIIQYLQAEYPDGDDAIAAYNAGSPRRSKKDGKYVNQSYVDKVRAVMTKLTLVT